MPHNAFFGLSNYVTLAIALIVVVVLVAAVWWLGEHCGNPMTRTLPGTPR
jgi:hypothetical protein